MKIPVWLTLGFGALIVLFGSFRIWMALKKKPQAAAGSDDAGARGGFQRMSSRAHLFVGSIYVLLGIALIATSFGFNPFGDMFGSTKTPAANEAPSKPGIPVDTVKPTTK